MENRVTIDDPGAFTKPFTVTFMATLSPPGDELMEHLPGEQSIRRADDPGFNPLTGETKK